MSGSDLDVLVGDVVVEVGDVELGGRVQASRRRRHHGHRLGNVSESRWRLCSPTRKKDKKKEARLE